MGVGDPELLAVEEVVVASLLGAGLQSEGVGAGGGLAERVGADGVGREPGKKELLLLRRGPAQQGVDAERVLHVDEDADRGVDGGDLFDGEDGLEEGSAGAAVLVGDFDAHQAEVEELRNELGVKCCCSSMVRTRGAIFSCANWRTVSRNSCSSSESRVSGEAGCDARTESATGIKLPLKRLPVQRAQDDFHFWSLCSN